MWFKINQLKKNYICPQNKIKNKISKIKINRFKIQTAYDKNP